MNSYTSFKIETWKQNPPMLLATDCNFQRYAFYVFCSINESHAGSWKFYEEIRRFERMIILTSGYENWYKIWSVF